MFNGMQQTKIHVISMKRQFMNIQQEEEEKEKEIEEDMTVEVEFEEYESD